MPQVTTLVTAIPVFVAIIALVVDGNRVAEVKITTGLLALFGAALLITDGYFAKLAGARQNLFGIALVLICEAGAAAYVVLNFPVVAEWGALRATALTMMPCCGSALGCVGQPAFAGRDTNR